VITRDDIHCAYDTIRSYLRWTPVVQLDLTGPVTLKLEQLQCAGSFKARGAFTNLLLRDVPTAGVAAASGGNHGVAVAYAAHRLGIPARIFVPTVSSPAKIERIRQLADLVITGDRYADALQAAQQWIATSGAMSVAAYDQQETILGQATLALELDDQAGPLDTVWEGLIGVTYFGDRQEVDRYIQIFSSLQAIALDETESMSLRLMQNPGLSQASSQVRRLRQGCFA